MTEMENVKKEYQAPQIQVLEYEGPAVLQANSGPNDLPIEAE